MPSPITREFLVLGRTRYEAFCAPCHGITGYGNGMIVQRGFPAPPSFHTQRLRDVPPEYIVDVITNGFGRMFSYAYRVPEDERWAIAAYIRALQLSQNATLDDVPLEERQQLQGAAQ
jgi:mono/diheme cytochrome c family protein